MKATDKILVVDDERQICQNVEKILAKNKYRVTLAGSAEDALKKMEEEPFSLLLSDIVMPDINGLDLLKRVKSRWPQTKAVMMTAYASTETAVKAIRLGALNYISKPFTPDELRSAVETALTGDLPALPTSEKERAFIDVDIPFDPDEVSRYTGEDFVKRLGPSDMPVVEAAPETLENYCELGNMVCDIFKKLGHTCKGGAKTGECPTVKAKKKKAAKAGGFDAEKLIGIDCPFDYDEVASITGPEYVMNLGRDGFAFVPYEELKVRVAKMMAEGIQRREPVEEIMQAPVPADILVIDDEIAVNNNIRKILSMKGFTVDQATSKDEAMDKIEGTTYKLILLDLKIPGVKGLELLTRIRDRQPETRVIIITGYASIETAVEGARLGIVGYIHKPFTPDEIREAAENAFKLAA